MNLPALGAVIALALALRLIHVSLGVPMPLRSDASGYDAAARRLVSAGSYAYPVGRDLWDEDVFREAAWERFGQRSANAFAMPGYAWFVAAVYRLSGTGPERLPAVRWAQAVLGALTVAMVFLIADAVLGRRAAWAAAGLNALYPPGIWACGYLLTETLFTGLLVGQVWAMVRAAGSRRVAPWVVLGVVTAAAFYVRPVALLVPALLVIHEAARRGARGSRESHLPVGALAARVAVLGGVVALLLTPWVIRNQRIYGVFMPASSAAALPMVQGRLIARGLPVPAETIPQLADLAPFGYDDHAYAERTAAGLAAAIPPASAGERVASAIRRLVMLAQALTSPFTFFSLPVPVLSWGFAMQSGLLALATLGAWRRRRDRRTLVLIAGVPVGLAIAYWLVAILWSRYLYPAMPLVLALAGAGAVSLVPAPRRGPAPRSGTR